MEQQIEEAVRAFTDPAERNRYIYDISEKCTLITSEQWCLGLLVEDKILADMGFFGLKGFAQKQLATSLYNKAISASHDKLIVCDSTKTSIYFSAGPQLIEAVNNSKHHFHVWKLSNS